MEKIENVKAGYVEAIRSQMNMLKEITKDGMYPDDLEWVVIYEKSIYGIEKYLSALEALYKTES